MRIRKSANERVRIGNVSLAMLIEYTNRKRTISLQVKDNKLIIKAPRTVSRKNLDEVIQKKQKWIKQRAILNFEEQKLRNRKFIDNEKFYFRGNQYRLSLIFGGKEEVKIVDGLLLVTFKDDRSIDSKNVKSLIEDWYVRESAKILNTRTEKKRNSLIKQSIDLAKLSQNNLTGKDLTEFINRSIDLIK